MLKTYGITISTKVHYVENSGIKKQLIMRFAVLSKSVLLVNNTVNFTRLENIMNNIFLNKIFKNLTYNQ